MQRRALGALGRHEEREQGVLGDAVPQPHRANVEGEKEGLGAGPVLVLNLGKNNVEGRNIIEKISGNLDT